MATPVATSPMAANAPTRSARVLIIVTTLSSGEDHTGEYRRPSPQNIS
jgi:hypothetical protein